MRFPAESLVPSGGTMYSHVFENSAVGIARDHFWSATVNFEPVEYAGAQWQCSLTIEWLRGTGRKWRSIGHGAHSFHLQDPLVECSFYMDEHHRAVPVEFQLKHAGKDRFAVRMGALVDFAGYSGDDADPRMPIRANTEISYEGLVIVPDNIETAPSSPAAISALASAFVDIADYGEPEQQGFRYLLRPKQ